MTFLNGQEILKFILIEKIKDIKKNIEDMKHYVIKYDALDKKSINQDEKYAYFRALTQTTGARNLYAPHVRHDG
ncbi:MAG: hypothetical protein JW902_16625 [Syntrophaceae bacterium]|nr:hypothetical protein [Syntrophaceae bacterium]